MKRLIIISPFTPKGYKPGHSGGGMSYNTGNTIEGLLKADPELNIELLAEKDSRFKNEVEGRLMTTRVWDRGKVKLWWQLWKTIRKDKKGLSKTPILIEFEFAAYGWMYTTVFILPFLLMLKIKGHRTLVVIHQVILNLEDLKGHLGLESKLLLKMFSLFVSIFYIILGKLANKIVVFEQVLKNRLLQLKISTNKIHVIPHGIIKTNSQLEAGKLRSKYGFTNNDFVLVVFGYVTWYKGTDWLAEAVNHINKVKNNTNMKLVIAGGKSSTYSGKKYYEEFFRKVEKLAESNSNIILTGFIPQEEVEDYYKLADLLIFPYRVLMSSSGPLSWALVYERPFLLSENISGYLKTSDAKKIFSRHLVHPDQLFFKLDYEDFYKKLRLVEHDQKWLGRLGNYSKDLGEQRTWDKLAGNYLELLFTEGHL